MFCKSTVRPVLPSVTSWQDVKFSMPIIGWHELAVYIALRTPPPHRSSNALRLAFWAGGIPLRAVRYGQKIVFDQKSVDAWIKHGGAR